jgi:RNA polymerase-binding transcription factor DksA
MSTTKPNENITTDSDFMRNQDVTAINHYSSTEVSDEADLAQLIQMNELAHIQDRARKANAPESHPDFDGVHCVDCDDTLPENRLKFGRVRCTTCQSDIEKRSKKR